MSFFLKGNQIYFRPLTLEEVCGPSAPMTKWLEDRDVVRYLNRGIYPYNPAQAKTEFDEIRKSKNDVEFGLADLKTKQLIGVLGLYGMDPITRVGELRILIGEKTHWGKGLGLEATQLLCCYGFESLNLHKIFLGVNSENKAALQCYLRADFVQEGVFRKEFYYQGKYVDTVRLGLLRSEYEQKKTNWKAYSAFAAQ